MDRYPIWIAFPKKQCMPVSSFLQWIIWPEYYTFVPAVIIKIMMLILSMLLTQLVLFNFIVHSCRRGNDLYRRLLPHVTSGRFSMTKSCLAFSLGICFAIISIVKSTMQIKLNWIILINLTENTAIIQTPLCVSTRNTHLVSSPHLDLSSLNKLSVLN